MFKKLKVFFLAILTGLNMIPGLVVDLFVDVHRFLDEKKIWGAIYLTAALVAPFVLTLSDVTVLGTLVVIGIALFLGVPLGDQVPIVANLKGLGLFDLITNKANKGDPSRIFGNVFLAAALAYLFSPLWKTSLVIKPEYFGVLAGVGVVMFGVAIFGDKTAVAKEQGTT